MFIIIAAMYDFARAQDEWYSTWTQDPRERGMAVYVLLMILWRKFYRFY